MGAFFSRNYKVIGAVTLVIIAGGVYWYVAANEAPSLGTITAARGNVVQSVDVSGNIAAENKVDLAFQEPGSIAGVYVTEGQKVSQGTMLAALNGSMLAASLEGVKATLAAAQAKLDGLVSGTRPEELQIDETNVASAQAALGVAVENAYAAADDAVKNQVDSLFSNVQSGNPTFLVHSVDTQAVITVQNERVLIGNALAALQTSLQVAGSDPSSVATTTDALVQQIQSYLNAVAPLVNEAAPDYSMSASALAAYKLEVSTARTEVNAAASALAGAEAASNSAEGELALAKAGATPQDIEAQKAVVLQAQAAVSSAQVAVDQSVLRAPFWGTVENLTAKIGQVVSPAAPVLSLVNDSGLKIETYVSETDVAKVAAGDNASVTVDAYGPDVVFPATVTTISATQTNVNGSGAYEVVLHFKNPDNRLKDGMSASVHIIVAEHDNVVEVPSRLVVGTDGSYFVIVKKGHVSQKQPVAIGIVGDDGNTEITSGLSAGDTLANF